MIESVSWQLMVIHKQLSVTRLYFAAVEYLMHILQCAFSDKTLCRTKISLKLTL